MSSIDYRFGQLSRHWECTAIGTNVLEFARLMIIDSFPHENLPVDLYRRTADRWRHASNLAAKKGGHLDSRFVGSSRKDAEIELLEVGPLHGNFAYYIH